MSAKNLEVLRRTWIAICALCVLSPSDAQSLRGIQPEDVLRVQKVSAGSFSPDGRQYAFTMGRSYIDDDGKSLGNRPAEDGDVWLATIDGRLRRITNGTKTHQGCHDGIWSPGGGHLAILCDDERTTRLYVWSVRSDILEAVDHRTVIGIPFWLSENDVAFICAPSGWTRESSAGYPHFRPPVRRKTSVAAVSQYASGPHADVLPFKSSLSVFNVLRGSRRVAAARSGLRVLSSSNKDLLFTYNLGVRQASQESNLYQLWARPYELGLALLLPNGEVRDFGALEVIPLSGTFNASGSEFVFVGLKHGDPNTDLRVFTLDVHSGRIEVVGEDTISTLGADRNISESAVWTLNGDLAVRGTKINAAGTDRRDWWLRSADCRFVNLTERMTAVPNSLTPALDGDSLFGLSEGKLWRLKTSSPSSAEAIGVNKDYCCYLYYDDMFRDKPAHSLAIIGWGDHPSLVIDLTTGASTELRPTGADAQLVSFSLKTRAAALLSRPTVGHAQSLWLVDSKRKQHLVVENNRYMRGIVEPMKRHIMYRSANGEMLNAWLFLPVQYKSGHRFPLVVSVYGGEIQNAVDHNAFQDLQNPSTPLSAIYLTSKGYGVLFPSIPLPLFGTPNDPVKQFVGDVMPAVDEVVRAGYADDKRLGLFGYSYGAYSVYSLLSQTNRFQAAVAGAGDADLFSAYGTFNAKERSYHLGFPTNMAFSEGGQINLGVPPWEDTQKYILNSPIFGVSKIQTPLLIFHGDRDSDIPVEQSEEMFSALKRLNRRAMFLRYWDDDHADWKPADILNLWNHIVSWFDRYLACDREQIKRHSREAEDSRLEP